MAWCASAVPASRHQTLDRGHGRRERRRIDVWVVPTQALLRRFPAEWVGLRRIIRVERWRSIDGLETHTVHLYISSWRRWSAERFAAMIRGHWQIENNLHWVKDVILAEDGCQLRGKPMAINAATIRSAVISAYRCAGFGSITYAIAACANKIGTLAAMLL